MATLALAAVGAAAGSAFLPAGLTVFGATLTGAAIGTQIGALAGSVIDQSLLGASGQSRTVEGPRLQSLRVTASTEGAPIPRLYGRARLGGQIIWATNFEEDVITTQAGGSGKGGSSRGGGASSIEYRYFANFAVALAEGVISGIGRVWADGREIDLSLVTHRVYTGTDTQLPDALIAAKQGADQAPAYRGVAYVVFERFPLADFGNRIPQLSFEVHRAVDSFESLVRGVCLIPGSGEFAYAPEPVTRLTGRVTSVLENVHTRLGGSDWSVALNQLATVLPNANAVSFIVSWFGSDLRAGACQLRPCVERADKVTTPNVWSVAGLTRATAPIVSYIDGYPAYGGTPSDDTVVAAIRDLKARGHSVTLTPFILMDVPAGNALPDPYTSAASQPAYPWRGRITISPAAGQPGSPDKTSAAAAQLAAFIGSAQPAHFALAGDAVVYSGPAEWSYRRMVLHNAYLAKAAGGVDAFLIGSELRGLTQARSAASTYPFVAALQQLAADCKAILGPATKITYTADWTEYFGHQPADGSGDVHFHLDPLWASPAIDAVGIDCYWPLADWRDGTSHLDWLDGARSIHDLDYLKSNLFAGEGYDWYYASPAARDAQTRTPITDGAGKPWVFRTKDMRAWWSQPHYDRPGGAELASPTAWVPQSKPIWLMEIGCPAIDKGANQPNVFVDPKSAENAQPYYSTGVRDDYMQRRYLQALLEGFDPAHPGYVAGANPVSAVYGGRMLDLARIHVYTWDARPYPAFPHNAYTWGDSENWKRGHWLNGRVTSASLAFTVGQILTDYGFTAFDATALTGTVPGLVIDRIMSARDALNALELAMFFDARESGGQIVFSHRGANGSVATVTPPDLVEERANAPLITLTRTQETDLPAAAKIAYIGGAGDYPAAVAEARRLAGASGRIAEANLPLVLDAEQAGALAETWLFEAWSARDRAAFVLPPSALALEPGDMITLEAGGRSHRLRITEVGDHGAREIMARGIDPSVYQTVSAPARDVTPGVAPALVAPLAIFLDVPLIGSSGSAPAGHVAAAQVPWPGTVAFYRAPEQSGFDLAALVAAPAVTGVTLTPLPAGPVSRLDRGTTLRVELDRGALTSVTPLALLSGANVAAIETAPHVWELVQFQSAILVAPSTYDLSLLLRGQSGSDNDMSIALPAGARFVLLDAAVTPVGLALDEIGLAYNWKAGPAARDIGDPSYAATTHAFRGVALRPLSPVHVRATRSGGDLLLSWIRRTRVGGDSWDSAEVPLGESAERYEIDILDGATVKRTLTTASPAATYSAADISADFPSGLPNPLSVRVAQISPERGRGSLNVAQV